MKLRDVVGKNQLRWGHLVYGPILGNWSAISFAQGTYATSQLCKLKQDDALISVCVGDHNPSFHRCVTEIVTTENFAALTGQLVKPSSYKRSIEKFGHDRWPTSIAIRQAWSFAEPPSLTIL